MNNGAIFSPCGLFRYEVSRIWDPALPLMVRIGLNPSYAGADVNDQTVRKDIGFAKRLECGGVVGGNLYAYIATYPRDLRAAGYPVGPENDAHLERMCSGPNKLVVCAWGGDARGLDRPVQVMAMLRRLRVSAWALHINTDGTPAHPARLSYDRPLVPFRG